MAEPVTDDTVQSLLSLIKLFETDYDVPPYGLDARATGKIINKAAWTLRENGWGLVGDDTTIKGYRIANAVTGVEYQLSTDRRAMIPVGDLNLSEFVDPTEPDEHGTLDVPGVVVKDESAPPTSLPFVLPLAAAHDTVQPQYNPPPSITPADVLARLDEMDHKINVILSQFDALGYILDEFKLDLDRELRGYTKLVGTKLEVKLTPVKREP